MDRWYRIFADKRTIAGVFLFIAIVLGGTLWYLEKKSELSNAGAAKRSALIGV